MTSGARPERSRWRDAEPGGGVAVLTALVQAVGTGLAARAQAADVAAFGYVLLVVGGLALSNRLRHPRATFLFVAAVTAAYHLAGQPTGPTVLALVVAGAAAGRAGHRALVAAVSTAAAATWLVAAGPGAGAALTLAAWLVGLGLLAETAQLVGDRLGRLIAEQRRLEEERRLRQASEERLRIARELHDVLGHHLSLINLRAGVGLHLKDRDPAEAWAALAAIRQASAEALGEVQAVLATLSAGDAAPREPAPGLDRLAELTADAGIPVRATVESGPPLPPEVDRAAYRIVREALTNVRRHARPGAAASIMIGYGREGALVVQVDDDGGGAAAPGGPAGTGVSGMRERAAALGGALTAGPLPGGGWRVRAILPLPEGAREAP
jgi:signal transduction histidine kinase